jgi:hypothetical protein
MALEGQGMAQRTRGLAALAAVCGVAVCGLVAGGVALARGPTLGPPLFSRSGGFGGFVESHYEAAPAPVRERRSPRKRASAVRYGQAVCVRLCDGFFFPTNSSVGGESTCAAQCPDAPTELYTMTSDKIDDAVSSTGALYSKLPVANRYQTSFESTCTCHRETTASRTEELLRDTTLRRGDVVMTAQGFRVYVGDAYGPSGPGDFVDLSQARGLPTAERAELVAMERSSAGSPERGAPGLIAHRPKGRVTVENGTRARNP